jgi:hypothetical protein
MLGKSRIFIGGITVMLGSIVSEGDVVWREEKMEDYWRIVFWM